MVFLRHQITALKTEPIINFSYNCQQVYFFALSLIVFLNFLSQYPCVCFFLSISVSTVCVWGGGSLYLCIHYVWGVFSLSLSLYPLCMCVCCCCLPPSPSPRILSANAARALTNAQRQCACFFKQASSATSSVSSRRDSHLVVVWSRKNSAGHATRDVMAEDGQKWRQSTSSGSRAEPQAVSDPISSSLLPSP